MIFLFHGLFWVWLFGGKSDLCVSECGVVRESAAWLSASTAVSLADTPRHLCAPAIYSEQDAALASTAAPGPFLTSTPSPAANPSSAPNPVLLFLLLPAPALTPAPAPTPGPSFRPIEACSLS